MAPRHSRATAPKAAPPNLARRYESRNWDSDGRVAPAWRARSSARDLQAKMSSRTLAGVPFFFFRIGVVFERRGKKSEFFLFVRFSVLDLFRKGGGGKKAGEKKKRQLTEGRQRQRGGPRRRRGGGPAAGQAQEQQGGRGRRGALQRRGLGRKRGSSEAAAPLSRGGGGGGGGSGSGGYHRRERRLHLGGRGHLESLALATLRGPLGLQEGAGLCLGRRKAEGPFPLRRRRCVRFWLSDLEILQLGRGRDERDRCDGVRERRRKGGGGEGRGRRTRTRTRSGGRRRRRQLLSQRRLRRLGPRFRGPRPLLGRGQLRLRLGLAVLEQRPPRVEQRGGPRAQSAKIECRRRRRRRRGCAATALLLLRALFENVRSALQ